MLKYIILLFLSLSLSNCFEDDVKKLKQIKELPNPFIFDDGSKVASPSDWIKRRDEIKAMAQHYEYGYLPSKPDHLNATLHENNLDIEVTVNKTKITFNAKVTLPKTHTKPYPVLIVGGRASTIFTQNGIAEISLNLPSIASDDKNKHGVFYQLYPNSTTGVLMAWAWSYHRVIDALATLTDFDVHKISVTGHSRYGKAALLAGAFDDRVAITYPMSSGLSGVGNYRFFYEEHGKAEKIENAYGYAPWWYTPLFGKFVEDVTHLPFDQHSIMALVAPRGLLITEGTEDYWTNPQGTSVSFRAARIVYEYLNVAKHIGIAYRAGSHAPTDKDYEAMVRFADVYYNVIDDVATFNDIPYPEDKAAIPWSAPT